MNGRPGGGDRRDIPALTVNPRWGLEAIIAHLAGFPPNEVGPLAEREAPAPGV
jgi:hypothetical protein